MLIAQLTDPHVLAGTELLSGWIDTRKRFSSCITWLNNFSPRPDVVLLTGDLVDHGTDEEYAEFKERLSPLTIPYFLVPGNHDARDNFKKAFSDQKYIDQKSEFIQYSIDDHPVRLIGLDTLKSGEMYGELCPTRLNWLEKELNKDQEKPTIIFMHHPPFNCSVSALDNIKCRDGDKLAEIIASHTNIERVLCGHAHRHICVGWAGTVGIISPSAAIQIELELSELSPETIVPWSAHEQIAFMLHYWDEENGVISHVNHLAV